MEFFRHIPRVDFIGKRYLFFVISGAMIGVGIIAMIVRGGMNLGIDFTGGNHIQLKFSQKVAVPEIRRILAVGGITSAQLQDFPLENSVAIRVKGTTQSRDTFAALVKQTMESQLPAGTTIVVERSEYVGPTIGKSLVQKAVYAILFSLLGIIVYVGIRFKSSVWGISGVIALVHDVFITLGMLVLFNREITLLIITALLTLAGYSINDTIVILDRIREKIRLNRDLPLSQVINLSINETLSRTVNTSLTVALVLTALFFLGGEVIHDFSAALLFGIIIGAYSTVAIATPIAYEWNRYRQQQIRDRKK